MLTVPVATTTYYYLPPTPQEIWSDLSRPLPGSPGSPDTSGSLRTHLQLRTYSSSRVRTDKYWPLFSASNLSKSLCCSPQLKSFNQHLECFRDGAPSPLSPVDRPSCPWRPPAASSSCARLAPGVCCHVQSQTGVTLEL